MMLLYRAMGAESNIAKYVGRNLMSVFASSKSATKSVESADASESKSLDTEPTLSFAQVRMHYVARY